MHCRCSPVDEMRLGMPPTDELPMTELRRILVVDDSKFYRALMACVVGEGGVESSVAADG